MKKSLLALALSLFFLGAAQAQTSLTLVNNTSKQIVAAYAIFNTNGDGWTTYGWYLVDAYSEKYLSLGAYSGYVYIHGHNSNGTYWGSDVTLCTGGSSAFTVRNADEVRCEYSRRFTQYKVGYGGRGRWTFNP